MRTTPEAKVKNENIDESGTGKDNFLVSKSAWRAKLAK